MDVSRNLFGSPVKRSLFGSGSPRKTPYSPKRDFRRTAKIHGIPTNLKDFPPMTKKIGQGSFANVFEATTPIGKKVVVKENYASIRPREMFDGTRSQTPEQMGREYYDSPGCIPGVRTQDAGDVDNQVSTVVPYCTPLTPDTQKEKINKVIDKAPIGAVRDLKPENMGIIPQGGMVPILVDEMILYIPQSEEEVVITDVGHTYDFSSADAQWASIHMDEAEDGTVRSFKKAIMEEWMNNPEEDPNSRREKVERLFGVIPNNYFN